MHNQVDVVYISGSIATDKGAMLATLGMQQQTLINNKGKH
jgi:hypothetical protein